MFAADFFQAEPIRSLSKRYCIIRVEKRQQKYNLEWKISPSHSSGTWIYGIPEGGVFPERSRQRI